MRNKNILNIDKFYNYDTKEEYLDSLESEGTRGNFELLFSKSKSTEEFFEKDLLSFNLNEIGKVVQNTNPTTIISAVNTVSRIRRYISWAITNGRRQNNIHPLDGVSNKWERQFVDDMVKRFITEEGIKDIVDDLPNAQDQALVQCIFEGVNGKGLSELLTLNAKRIDWDNNELTLVNEKGEIRKITVSDRCMRLIDSAYREEVYYLETNGTELELVDYQDNIFKNVSYVNSKFKEVTIGTLRQRISRIKNNYDLEEFSATTVSQSGQIKMAKDIYEETGSLNNDDLERIGEVFNTSRINTEFYNNKINLNKLRYYINPKNLKDLYNIDIKKA